MKFNSILSITTTQKLNINLNNFLRKTYHWMVLFTCVLKNLPAVWETWVRSLGWEDPLEKGKATRFSILAWRIPWTVQSVGSQRVRHNWVTFTFTLFQVASVMSDSLWPHILQSARWFCPWNSPGKNPGVGCPAPLQGTFPTQGQNSCLLPLLHWQVFFWSSTVIFCVSDRIQNFYLKNKLTLQNGT